MPRAQGIRRRGWLAIVLGFLLVAMMGAITFNVGPTMLSGAGSSGAKFNGTPEQAILILGLFGLVIVFGLTCVASGLWQLVTGRRSIWIVVVVLGLTFLLIVAGSAVRSALDRGSDRSKVGQYMATSGRKSRSAAQHTPRGKLIHSPLTLGH